MKNISLREQFDMMRRVVDKPTALRSNRILMSFQSKCVYLRSKSVNDPFYYQLLYENYMAKAERAFSDKKEPEYKELGACLKGLLRQYHNDYRIHKSILERANEAHSIRINQKARELFHTYSRRVREDLFKMAEKVRMDFKFPDI